MYGHQSFEFQLPGNTRASFLWAPYTANISQHLHEWCAMPLSHATALDRMYIMLKGVALQSAKCFRISYRHQNGTRPDVLVAGTALWHALHVHNVDDFEQNLGRLRSAKLALVPDVPASFLSSSQVP